MIRIIQKYRITMFLLFSLSAAGGCSDSSPGAAIGVACDADDDCPDDLFCSQSSPTDVCAATCSSDAQCQSEYGDDFDCVNSDTRCARRCINDSDCPGTDCVPFTGDNSYCSD